MSKEIDNHVLELFDIEQFLGSGAYGHVWKVTHRHTGKQYALKKIFGAFQNDIDAQRTYREVSFLHQLEHDNIVKLQWVIKAHDPRDLYLVFELVQTDLHSLLGQNILGTPHIRFITYQICKVLKYLHSAQLIHRDLKSSNILINSNCEIKLCDFGLVRSLVYEEQNRLVLSEDVATRWYRSPQLLLGSQNYGKPTDMWSLGCILAELINGQPLFAGTSTLDQIQKIIEFTGIPSRQTLQKINAPNADAILAQLNVKRRPLKSYFDNCEQQILQMILKMLQFDPSKRITAQQVLQLPCLQQFRGKSTENMCNRFVMTQVDDNVRLTLQDYRRLIYRDIQRQYPDINKPTPLPRIYRSYHSLKSRNSPEPFHRVAANSLLKMAKNQQILKQSADVSCIEQNPVHRLYKKRINKMERKDKENKQELQRSFQQQSNTKILKRRAKNNLWNKPTHI